MAVSGGSSGGSTGGAIRAGKAFVEMGIDTSGVGPALEKVKKSVLGIAKNVAIGGAAVGGVGAALFAPIFSLFEKTVAHATEVRKASEQLGTTTEIFSGLAFGAKKVGVDSEGLVTAARRMQIFVSTAAEGGGEAADMLKRIGINAKQLNSLPLDEQINAIADGIARIDNIGEQADITRKIFGRGGVSLLPLLRQGSAGIKEFAAQAKEFGLVVSTEEAAKAKTWTKAVGQLESAFEGLKLAVGAALLEIAEPAKQWSDVLVRIIKDGREWVEENGQLILGIATVGAILIGAGAALVAFAGGVTAVVFAIGALGTAATAVGSVLAAIFSPVGLGIATLAVAAVMVVALADELGILEDVVNTFTPVWEGLLDTFNTTWQGIKDALSGGDLKLAFKIAVAGLNVVWKGFLVGLQAAWNEFKDVFVDGWHAALTELKVAFAQFLNTMARSDFVARQFRNIANLGTPEEIRAQAARDLADRRAGRAGALDDAVGALMDAKKELKDLARGARPEGRIQDFRPKLFGAGVAAAVELAGVRGQFGGAGLASALGIGDQSIPKKQLDKLDDIDDKLGDIKGKVGGLKVE